MNRFVFLSMIFLMGLTFSCNQGNNSNNQQNFGPGGMGRGNFDPEEMATQQVEQMKELLDLSEEQEKQLYDLTMENFESMQEAREGMQQGGGFEGMREQMQKMREEQNNKIKNVLSEEQWEKYEAYQEEMRANRGQGRPGGFQQN